MSSKVASYNINLHFVPSYLTNEKNKNTKKVHTETSLDEAGQMQGVKRIAPTNVDNYFTKIQTATELQNGDNSLKQATGISPLLKRESFSKAASQNSAKQVKRIVLKKQNTLENLNSSGEEAIINVAYPQSARNCIQKQTNRFALNCSPTSKLDSYSSEDKLKSYFFPSHQLLAKNTSKYNENKSAIQSYFSSGKSMQVEDPQSTKKKIVLRRDLLHSARGVKQADYFRKEGNSNNNTQQSYSESATDLQKYDDDSDENTPQESKQTEYSKTSTDLKSGQVKQCFKERTQLSFQTQYIKKSPIIVPIKQAVCEEEIITVINSSTVQEDISNLNFATTACSSGNEEQQSPNILSNHEQLKIFKLKKASLNKIRIAEGSTSDSANAAIAETSSAKQNLALQLLQKLKNNKNSYFTQIKEARNKQIQTNENEKRQIGSGSSVSSQLMSQISSQIPISSAVPVQPQSETAAAVVRENTNNQSQTTEQILCSKFGLFDAVQEQNSQIKRLKILSLSECRLYEAFQINNLSSDYSLIVTSYIKKQDNLLNQQNLDKVLSYSQFIQSSNSSLLIFPLQANKTLKYILNNIKLLNEQLVKLFFKDVLQGLQQIYYGMKSQLWNVLEFDSIYFDENFNLRVGQNMNQNCADLDQICLSKLSYNSKDSQQQCNDFVVGGVPNLRDEMDCVYDFGFLLFKSLLGPSYTIFEGNSSIIQNDSNTTQLSNQNQSMILSSSNNKNYYSNKSSFPQAKSCCIFHEIKLISEKNITDSIVQLKKAQEIYKFITKNCSPQLQSVLCQCLRYDKSTRCNLQSLSMYFQLIHRDSPINSLESKQTNNASAILKLLFQQIQIKEKQSESVKQKTQKLQLLIRIKQIIANSQGLFQMISSSAMFEQLVQKVALQLSYNLSISLQEILSVIYPKQH